MTFVPHLFIKIHTVLCVKARREVTFLDLIGLFDSRDTVGTVRRRLGEVGAATSTAC
jgi:hypothetical protein